MGRAPSPDVAHAGVEAASTGGHQRGTHDLGDAEVAGHPDSWSATETLRGEGEEADSVAFHAPCCPASVREAVSREEFALDSDQRPADRLRRLHAQTGHGILTEGGSQNGEEVPTRGGSFEAEPRQNDPGVLQGHGSSSETTLDHRL